MYVIEAKVYEHWADRVRKWSLRVERDGMEEAIDAAKKHFFQIVSNLQMNIGLYKVVMVYLWGGSTLQLTITAHTEFQQWERIKSWLVDREGEIIRIIPE